MPEAARDSGKQHANIADCLAEKSSVIMSELLSFLKTANAVRHVQPKKNVAEPPTISHGDSP